jgi:hypothetical protein
MMPKFGTSLTAGLVPQVKASSLLAEMMPKFGTSFTAGLVPQFKVSSVVPEIMAKIGTPSLPGDGYLRVDLASSKYLFADAVPGSFLSKVNTSSLTAGLDAGKMYAGSQVASTLRKIADDGLLDRLSSSVGDELTVELAAPRTANLIFDALGGVDADPSRGAESELLDQLGVAAADALGRASGRIRIMLESLTLRSARRYIALVLLIELQIVMYVSDRQLYDLINSHFGFVANILAVWIFLRPRSGS